jgi:hypothetical protein
MFSQSPSHFAVLGLYLFTQKKKVFLKEYKGSGLNIWHNLFKERGVSQVHKIKIIEEVTKIEMEKIKGNLKSK